MTAIKPTPTLNDTYNDIWATCKDGLEGLNQEEKIELISNMIFMKRASTTTPQKQKALGRVVN